MQLRSTHCHTGNRCTHLPFSVRGRHHRFVNVEVRISSEMTAYRKRFRSFPGNGVSGNFGPTRVHKIHPLR
jgi:hypothetical protein